MSIRRLTYLALVALSLALTYLHSAPLRGTGIALVLVVLLQLVLPGVLLTRTLRLHRSPDGTLTNPVVQFVWALAGGVGLTIVLGGLLRSQGYPVTVYNGVLHVIMVLLAIMSPPTETASPPPPRRSLVRLAPLYGLLLVCCGAMFYAGVMRNQIRFSFADPSLFAGQVNWLANETDEVARIYRLPGISFESQLKKVTRFEGWTYVHADWVRVSGVGSAEFIWYYLTPLLIWTIPVIFFATAYVLVEREAAAAWSAAAVTLFALMTLDNLVYLPNITLAFGRTATYMAIVRNSSTAFVTPLAIFTAMAFFKNPHWRRIVVLVLVAQALALIRIRQTAIFMLVAGGTFGLWWLGNLRKQPKVQSIGLALVLATAFTIPAFFYLLPTLQGNIYYGDRSVSNVSDLVERAGEDGTILSLEGIRYRVIEDIPVIERGIIIDPPVWFYHPIILLAVILGILSPLWIRDPIVTPFLFSTSILPVFFAFTPGVVDTFVNVFGSVATSNLLAGLVFAVQVPLVLGFAVERVLRLLRRGSLAYTVSGWIVAVGAAAFIIFWVTEPVPLLPHTAHDQIRTMNDLQTLRHTPAQISTPLLDDITAAVSDIARPNIVANHIESGLIVESVPGALATGGRDLGGSIHPRTSRFYTQTDPRAPFLDAFDVDKLIAKVEADLIVVSAEDTRVPQLLLDTTRFVQQPSSTGYYLFKPRNLYISNAETPGSDGTPIFNNLDPIFETMNTIYGTLELPRWDRGTYYLPRAADPTLWTEVEASWLALLEEDPNNDTAKYGLAMTYLLMGDDDSALPLWQDLYTAHPDIPQLAEALARTRRHLNLDDPAAPLTQSLQSTDEIARVQAADTLLTDQFFYFLEADEIAQVKTIIDTQTPVTATLTDNIVGVRRRASLMLSIGDLDTAARWLDRLVPVEVSPEDMVARAMLHLTAGEVEAALAALQPATDPDWISPRWLAHRDRWQPGENIAAQTFYILQGDLAMQSGQVEAAFDAYERAIAHGSTIAAPYFLAQALAANDDEARAADLYDAAEAAWHALYDTPMPELVSLLALQGADNPFAQDITLRLDDEAGTLVGVATFAIIDPAVATYPVKTWQVWVTSPETGEIYGEAGVDARPVPGALVRESVQVALSDDLPPLTPARVFIEPRYNEAIIYPSIALDAVLNRPPSVTMTANTTPANVRYGESIMLVGYEVTESQNTLDVSLYWELENPVDADYQVFVHVIDAGGGIVAQRDTTPVDGRYPTGQWRTDATILDTHTIPLPDALPDGDYRVVTGLYTLPDGVRLPVNGDGIEVQNNSATIGALTR